MIALQKANARRQPSERVNELTDGQKLRASTRDVNATYGPAELCAWQVVPGLFWLQTTEPEFSRKLEKREDARRVENSGVNHFRRTFELRGTWRKIRRIIDRYLVSAGDQFSSRILLPARQKLSRVPTQRGDHK
jgi:hypothetical protein